MGNYQLTQQYHIDNNNQLSIFISIDRKYLDKLQKQVAKPFTVAFILSTLLLLLFVAYNSLITIYLNSFYLLRYKNHYERKLKKVKENYENEVSIKENALMKRIWSLGYSKDKDKELNRLFSQRANQLALFMQEDGALEIDIDYAKKSPCYIVLYCKNIPQEDIDTKSIVTNFSDRFINSEENIDINISSSEESIKFASKEFLYQIIYSIINCIIFILKEQPYSNKYNLTFVISKVD